MRVGIFDCVSVDARSRQHVPVRIFLRPEGNEVCPSAKKHNRHKVVVICEPARRFPRMRKSTTLFSPSSNSASFPSIWCDRVSRRAPTVGRVLSVGTLSGNAAVEVSDNGEGPHPGTNPPARVRPRSTGNAWCHAEYRPLAQRDLHGRRWHLSDATGRRRSNRCEWMKTRRATWV